MNNIFLAPNGRSSMQTRENFDSVLYGRSWWGSNISFNFVEQYLNLEEKEGLSKYESLKVWSVSDRHLSTWSEMRPGDWVLFYERKNFCYSAKIIRKKYSQELADKLWPNGNPYLFFIDNLKEINIPLEVISDWWGLGLGGWRSGLRQFMFLGGSGWGIKNIMEKFGSIENFIDHHTFSPGFKKRHRGLFKRMYDFLYKHVLNIV